MKKIVCLGDSNTYGYDPRGFLSDRYPPEFRWPSILSGITGVQVVNAGQNGRTIPLAQYQIDAALRQIDAEMPLDLLIVMLGTNDILTVSGPNPKRVGERMERFVAEIQQSFPKLAILLISPPPVEIPLAHIQQAVRDLEYEYAAIAQRRHMQAVSALQWKLPLAYDGIHLTPEANQIFAGKIQQFLETHFI